MLTSKRNLDAIILAGGRGTRIADLYPDLPKPLVPAGDQPFLSWICQWLIANGVTSLTLSVGYRATQIEAWAERVAGSFGVPVRCVHEDTPLGTGDAARMCLEGLGDKVLICNGDSMVLADLAPAIMKFQCGMLDGLIVSVPMEQADRYGTLDIDNDNMLRGFFEKRPGAGMVNAGIYLFRHTLLASLPIGVPLSLEQNVLPGLLRANARVAVWSAGKKPFLDIGTPDSVVCAASFIQEVPALLERIRTRNARVESATASQGEQYG